MTNSLEGISSTGNFHKDRTHKKECVYYTGFIAHWIKVHLP